MVKKFESREWTETYHSWNEYVARNPNWDKHTSSAIAGGLAKMYIERDGVYVAHCFTAPLDPVTHRDVCNFLKRLDKATRESRKSKLQFD